MIVFNLYLLHVFDKHLRGVPECKKWWKECLSTENAGSQNKELDNSLIRYTKYTQIYVVAITDGRTRIVLRLNFTKNLNDYYPRTPNNLVLTVPD